jgi:hypothetical protein
MSIYNLEVVSTVRPEKRDFIFLKPTIRATAGHMPADSADLMALKIGRHDIYT